MTGPDIETPMLSGKQRSEVRWWHIRALPSSVCQREQASVCVCVVFLLSLPTMTCRIRPRLLSKTKRRRLCVCVCVSLSRWAPQSMTWHILHGAFSKLVAEVRVCSPEWWPSRKLQLSFSHLFLSLPVTRSLWSPTSTCWCHCVFLYPQCRYISKEIIQK